MERAARAAAYGKVILLGEHAVVYGVPALAAGIDRGARAEAVALGETNASADTDGGSTLTLGGRTVVASASSDDDLAHAFAALLAHDAPRVAVTASSELPPGGGLGSSAALGVAIARTVEELAGSPEAGREERMLARAHAWECVFAGTPSGIDSHAAAHGGNFRFVRGRPAQPLQPAEDLWLCIGLSGVGSSTRVMVEGLARLFQRKPELKQRSLDAIRSLVDNAALAIEAGDVEGLGKLMDLNQMVLAGLFLSTEAIERLCDLARRAGALGAKLTGSGGGGAVIALVRAGSATGEPEAVPSESASAVLDAWKSEGFEGFVTRIAAHHR